MEHLLLKILDFHMSAPTINWFLSFFLRFLRTTTWAEWSNGSFRRVEYMSNYLAELTLIDGDTFMAYLPSQLATCAIYLALATLGKAWNKQVADALGVQTELSAEMKQCVASMHKAHSSAATHPQQAVQEKYKQAKFDFVALAEPHKSLP